MGTFKDKIDKYKIFKSLKYDYNYYDDIRKSLKYKRELFKNTHPLVVEEYINTFVKLSEVIRHTKAEMDAIDFFFVFKEMFDKGFLSKKKTFEYLKYIFDDFEPFPGINIIKGGGNCRHAAHLLSNTLTMSEYKNVIITCTLGTDSNKNKVRNLGNHMCVMVEVNNAFYILDPINKDMSELKKDFTFEIAGVKGTLFIPGLLIESDLDFDGLISLKNKIIKEDKHFTKEELIEKENLMLTGVYLNKGEIKSFHRYIIENLKHI